MIVRPQDDGSLILLNQTDHAKLSGFFAAHWGNETFAVPSHRESTVRAAALHDCGWYRYETEPRYDPATKTSPTYFQVPNDASQLEAFGAGVDWLTSIDPYAGLLISRHRTGLWRRRYGAVTLEPNRNRASLSADVEAFAAKYEARQEVALAGLDRKEFLVNYQLLQIWDLLSLALCIREPVAETFMFAPKTYEGDGASGTPIAMTPLGGGEIRLDPYPFDRRPLTLGVPYRHLPTRDYPTETAFRMAYFGATPKLKTFTFV